MPKKTHEGAHKLERLTTAKNKVIHKCMIPGCSTYYSIPELVIGQVTVCWGCSDEFPMTRDHLRLRKPYCDLCRREREFRKRSLSNPEWSGTFIEESD